MPKLPIQALILLLLFLFLTLYIFVPVVLAVPRVGLSDVSRNGVVDIGDISFIGARIGDPPVASAALADVNQDGTIDISDITIAGANSDYVLTACELEDINNDGSLNQTDVSIVTGYLGDIDNSTNMIADLNGDGSINATDLALVQSCVPALPAVEEVVPTVSSNLPPSPPPNPNTHPNWKAEVMAGPNYVGLSSYIEKDDLKIFIDKTTHHDDLSITFSKPNIYDLPHLPWASGLNVVSEIVRIEAVSAFNGYPIKQTDKPFIVVLTYLPEKLLGLSSSVLAISHYDESRKRWYPLKSPVVVDHTKHTVATTTSLFGLFVVTYPASLWQASLLSNSY